MANLIDMYAEDGAQVHSDDSSPALTLGSVGAGPALSFLPSSASGTTFKVNNIEKGFVSTNSTASLSFAIRVEVAGSANTIYYVPAYLGKA